MQSKLFFCLSSLVLGGVLAATTSAASLDPITNSGASGVFEGLPLTLSKISDEMMTNTPLVTDRSAYQLHGVVLAEPGIGNTNQETLGQIVDMSARLGHGTYAIYDRLAYYTIVILLPGYTGSGGGYWSSDGDSGRFAFPTYSSFFAAQPGILGPQVGSAFSGGQEPASFSGFFEIPEPQSLAGLMAGGLLLGMRRRTSLA